MMNVNNSVSPVKLAINTIAFTLLDKSKTLDSLVKRITSGSVSRETLARKVINDTLNLACDRIISNKSLGEKETEILRQGRSVLFNNNKDAVKQGAGAFVESLLQYNESPSFMFGLGKCLAPHLGPELLKECCLERSLAEMAQNHKHGKDVIKRAIDNALAGVTGGKVISAVFMSALKHAIFENKAFEERGMVHKAAAWKIHEILTKDPASLPEKPLLLGALDIPQRLCETFGHPDLKHVNHALESMIFAHNSGNNHEDKNAALIATQHLLPPERHKEFSVIATNMNNFLKTMPLATCTLQRNWSNEPTGVTARQHAEHKPSSALVDYMNSGFRLPVQLPADAGAVVVGSAFVDTLQRGMALRVDNNAQPGSQLYQDDNFNELEIVREGLYDAQKQQIRQLAAMVDHHPLNLMALTHYINPEATLKAVEEKVIGQFEHKGRDLIFSAEHKLWVKIGQAKASVLVNKKEDIAVATTLRWPIEAFGPTPLAMKPAQGEWNTLSTTVNVNLKFNENGLKEKAVGISYSHINIEDTCLFPQQQTKQKWAAIRDFVSASSFA